MKRVVVTGMGLVTPLGVGLDHVWSRLTQGHSGIRTIQSFNTEDLPAKIAGQVPIGDGTEGTLDPETVFSSKDRRRVDDFIVWGVAAADMAIADAHLPDFSDEGKERVGVMIGSGIGGLPRIEDGALTVNNDKVRRLSPFFIPGALINLVSGQISIKHGFKGPNHAVVTACSSGAHAIGDAARLIMWGDADIMVAGGAEAAICRLGMAGFSQAKALSTGYNDSPAEASRPWDVGRDGFVMGEGSGVVVLEELESAKKRGARIYAEVTGYGLSGDAYHITAPAPDGNGGYRAMKAALARAKMDPSEIDYINAHGTSTPLGDEIEHGAVRRLFGAAADKTAMSSTKSAIGHLLGAAGAVESIFSIMAIHTGVVPPTLNLHQPSEGCDMNLVPLVAQERKVRSALCNSFGFGGTNASLVLSAVG